MAIHDFVNTGKVDLAALAGFLDGLPHAARLEEVRALSGKEQAALFEAAKGARALSLADFVPDTTAPMREVIHHGKNSLPMFSHFQKRFCKPDAAASELWGYNEQAMKWATGPGYFKARAIDAGQVLIDYFEVPQGAPPAGWPNILPNSARLSRFVYFHTQDTMRAVSKHVSIGRAARDGKWMDNWFALCRQE